MKNKNIRNLPSNKIYLSESAIPKAGRGIFAKNKISKGVVIERCPIIEIPEKQKDLMKKSELINYYFMWGKGLKKIAIALGYGSIYNHSYEPNATYRKRMKEKIIDFIAVRNIKKGEEITVNYNFGKPEDKTPLWIKTIKPA